MLASTLEIGAVVLTQALIASAFRGPFGRWFVNGLEKTCDGVVDALVFPFLPRVRHTDGGPDPNGPAGVDGKPPRLLDDLGPRRRK